MSSPASRIIGTALSDQEKRIYSNVAAGLDAHNQEMAQKTGILLGEYVRLYISPLEERIQWLELPWYRKLQARAEAEWQTFTAWRLWRGAKKARQSTKVDIAPAEPTPELDPAA